MVLNTDSTTDYKVSLDPKEINDLRISYFFRYTIYENYVYGSDIVGVCDYKPFTFPL